MTSFKNFFILVLIVVAAVGDGSKVIWNLKCEASCPNNCEYYMYLFT